MSVDLGHEFFKVALMRQGAPLEIVLNGHSKRKTSTAVSFLETVRTFGDDAVPHAGKEPAKVPMFFHSLLGHNFTAADILPGGRWWDEFALGDQFYSLNLGFDDDRQTPTFVISNDQILSGEEVLANVLSEAKRQSEEFADLKKITDLVVTVQSNANMRQRQAIVAAGEIAGCRVVTLVNSGAAFAVQKAVDFAPEKGEADIVLFYDLGSRKAEVTIAQFESRAAGMVAGKTAPVVNVLSSAVDFGIGGHFFDLKIAQRMLQLFQSKFPKWAEGILSSPRALRKLLAQAQKAKAVLSANKESPFIVESLYEDTDFVASMTRAEFEGLCEDMFAKLTDPIQRALELAGLTIKDVKHIEVVGGAWRVPKIQQLLSEFFKSEKLTLGQHLNGEEAAALGGALVGANSSSSFRVKKIFFSDVSAHAYSLQVVSLSGEWEKNITHLYPVGSPLGGKKKLSFTMEEDFGLRLFEDGGLIALYTFSNLAEQLTGKWKDYNLTSAPKVTVGVHLEGSGIIEIKSPTVTVEEAYWINVTKNKTVNATAKNTTSNTSKVTDNGTAAEEVEDGAGNISVEDNNTEPEVTQKLKKKKHEKKLAVTRTDVAPLPLTSEAIAGARKVFEAIASREGEVQAVNAAKNELEAIIYGSREKIEMEDILKVSTEEQREVILAKCTEFEDWSYEGSSKKSEYDQRITTLRDLLEPMKERAQEVESREDLPEFVESSVAKIQKTKITIEKKMPWVPSNKTEEAVRKLDDFKEWWSKKQAQQSKLPLFEAPAFTKKEVVDKLNKIEKEFSRLEKIKKPKEPKETTKPKKVKTTDKASGDSSKEKTEAEDFPSDIEEAKKLLVSVGDEKMTAITSEDYDKAHELKGREKKLKEHIEQLQSEKAEL